MTYLQTRAKQDVVGSSGVGKSSAGRGTGYEVCLTHNTDNITR